MPLQPVGETERYRPIDVLRGLALFGVLLINLLAISASRWCSTSWNFIPTRAGSTTWWISLSAAFVEFKALTLFSFLFGVGTAIQAERCAARGLPVYRFLLRRFAVLLAVGLGHIVLLWNGDILIPVRGLWIHFDWRSAPFPQAVAVLGLAAILLPASYRLDSDSPPWRTGARRSRSATRVYGQGSYLEIVAFRSSEISRLILPILWSVLSRTLGLMCWGVAAWRSGLLSHPKDHRRLLWIVLVAGLAIGGGTSLARALAQSSGHRPPVPEDLSDLVSVLPLAFAYASAVLLWLRPPRLSALAKPFAAAGQMALTNYLTQSIVLGFVFYGYGLGLFGRVDPAGGFAMACALYALQLAFSIAWLRRYRFGPFEWLWRSMTYGSLQPLRHPRKMNLQNGE